MTTIYTKPTKGMPTWEKIVILILIIALLGGLSVALYYMLKKCKVGDCKDGEVCNTSTGKCGKSDNPPCTGDGDCSSTQHCNGGICVDGSGKVCTGDQDDCADNNEFCYNGKCASTLPAVPGTQPVPPPVPKTCPMWVDCGDDNSTTPCTGPLQSSLPTPFKLYDDNGGSKDLSDTDNVYVISCDSTTDKESRRYCGVYINDPIGDLTRQVI